MNQETADYLYQNLYQPQTFKYTVMRDEGSSQRFFCEEMVCKLNCNHLARKLRGTIFRNIESSEIRSQQ